MDFSSQTITFDAGAALVKRRIAKIGAADYAVIQADDAASPLLGVTTDVGAASGGRCDVVTQGVTPVEYGGTVTRGDDLTADANGKAVKATKGTSFKQTIIDGGAAGDHAVAGIKAEDTLISVLHVTGDGTQLTGGEDLTAEFDITADDTINNVGGTSSANGVLIVTYLDKSGEVHVIGKALISGVSGDIGSVLIARDTL